MPRKKSYSEEEVLSKAMNLFWNNGYEQTSMQELEQKMGINKFSIYSSFGSKEGLLLASVKTYSKQLEPLLTKLKNSNKGKDAVKQYFNDFLQFCSADGIYKGCLISNIANGNCSKSSENINEAIQQFTHHVKSNFKEALDKDSTLSNHNTEAIANYLFIAMFGLSTAARVFSRQELNNYINNIFNTL